MFTDRATLASLPDELVLLIISFLNPQPDPCPGPFTQWSSLVSEQIQPASSQLRDVQALALCNKRLSSVTSGATTRFSVIEGREGRPLCLTRLDLGQIPRSRLATIFIDCENTYNVHDLFRLPSLHALTIRHFDGSLHPSPHYHEIAGQSSVRILKLMDCVCLGRTLADLLRLPTALREFWYSSNVMVWNNGNSNVDRAQSALQDGTPWSHFLFETAIAKQRTSLEKLVVSRSGTATDAIIQGNLFDLRQFKNLRSLCIDHCDMLDKFHPEDIWHRLPPELKELEVAYGDGNNNIKTYEQRANPQWLFLLLEPAQKNNYAQSLTRLRLLSINWSTYDDARQVDAEETVETNSVADSHATWIPPSEWIQRCETAKLSLSVFVGPDRRFRSIMDDDEGFADMWEDTWAM